MIPDASNTINKDPKKVLLVAGEASADLHGALVVKALKQIDPALSIYGIGGDELHAAGMSLLFHAKDLAVVGISEVVTRLPSILQAFGILKREIQQSPPGLVILIDYPDFNLRLAKIARQCQIPVLYYISPQIWAWRQSRAKKIARLVNRMAVVFPFEVPFYEAVGFTAQFVGHPLLDQTITSLDRVHTLKHFAIKDRWPIIGLLPGSRRSEIERLLPVMLDAATLIRDAFPEAQFIIPVAPGVAKEEIELRAAKKPVPIRCAQNQLYQALCICDLALVASGTATLETALMKTPMIILYRVSFLTYMIGRLMIRVPCIGLANIIAGKQVVPELIQRAATPEQTAREAISLLKNPGRIESMRKELARVREKLGEKGASQKVAEMAYEMLNEGIDVSPGCSGASTRTDSYACKTGD